MASAGKSQQPPRVNIIFMRNKTRCDGSVPSEYQVGCDIYVPSDHVPVRFSWRGNIRYTSVHGRHLCFGGWNNEKVRVGDEKLHLIIEPNENPCPAIIQQGQSFFRIVPISELFSKYWIQPPPSKEGWRWSSSKTEFEEVAKPSEEGDYFWNQQKMKYEQAPASEQAPAPASLHSISMKSDIV